MFYVPTLESRVLGSTRELRCFSTGTGAAVRGNLVRFCSVSTVPAGILESVNTKQYQTDIKIKLNYVMKKIS